MNHQDHQGHQEHQDAGTLDAIGREIVDSGFKVHQALGPGLLEATYEICLVHELSKRGLACERQVSLPVIYDDFVLEGAYRLDIVVSDAVIVEVKAVESLSKLHTAQLLSYLKLSGRRLGYLMNFNVVMFRDGVRRLIL